MASPHSLEHHWNAQAHDDKVGTQSAGRKHAFNMLVYHFILNGAGKIIFTLVIPKVTSKQKSSVKCQTVCQTTTSVTKTCCFFLSLPNKQRQRIRYKSKLVRPHGCLRKYFLNVNCHSDSCSVKFSTLCGGCLWHCANKFAYQDLQFYYIANIDIRLLYCSFKKIDFFDPLARSITFKLRALRWMKVFSII